MFISNDVLFFLRTESGPNEDRLASHSPYARASFSILIMTVDGHKNESARRKVTTQPLPAHEQEQESASAFRLRTECSRFHICVFASSFDCSLLALFDSPSIFAIFSLLQLLVPPKYNFQPGQHEI